MFAVLAQQIPHRSMELAQNDAVASDQGQGCASFRGNVTMTARSTSCEAAWSQCHGQHWPRQIRKDGSRHWL